MISATSVYIGISVILIGILLGLLIRCENKTYDNFCICKDIDSKDCRNWNQTIHDYESGELTETTDLKSKGWKNITNFSQY